MAFSFPYKTEAELIEVQNRSLLPKGTYPFKVKAATQEVSSKGNPMIKLTLVISDRNKTERIITDWLVATEGMVYKIKHFCDSVGLEDKYEKGSFEVSDCINKTGLVKIGISKGKPREDGTLYRDKNAVDDYVVKTETKLAEQKAAIDTDFNDAIPF